MDGLDKTLDVSSFTVRYRMHGKSTGGYHEKYGNQKVVTQNLGRLRNSFGNTSATLMLAKGGSDVAVVSERQYEVACDALVTFEAGHNLLLRPADCVPVLVYSLSGSMIALIHASRTSLEDGVIEKTMRVLHKNGLDAGALAAHLAPGIDAGDYQLPPSINGQLRHESWQGNLYRSDKGVGVDLNGFINKELKRLKLQGDRISTTKFSLGQERYFYSHYRATRHGEENGRNGFVCALMPK